MTDPDRRQFLQGAAGSVAAAAIVPDLETLSKRWRAPAAMTVGLVGAGRQGRAILGELATIEGVEVVAVCDVVEGRLSSGLRRVKGAEGFATHQELLEKKPDLDAVIVATPTHLHRQVAVDAVAAGKHVYCEAPLAHTEDDCRAIAAAARDSDKVFAVGYQARSNPVYTLARSFARSGSLRDLIAMRAQYHRKTSWRTPASTPELEQALNWQLDPEVSLGLVGEFGSHQLDTFHYFLGRYPVQASGRGSIRLYDDGRAVDDTVHADLVFDEGELLSYSATLANSYEGQYELLVGSMASFKLAWSHGWMFKEADAPTQGWEVYANRQHFHNDAGITLIADATQLASQGKLKEGVGLPNTSLYYALEAFLKSAAEGADVACGIGDGLRTTVVAIRAARAVATGEPQAIEPESLKDE